MQDRFDKNSVIVWARSGSRIVGSVRVTYCEEADDRFELDDSGVVPTYLPRRDTIEVSRLCVSDEFEGSNLVLGLIERAVEIGLNRQVKWVITSATDEKVRYYKNIGFATPGISFDLATLHGVPHHLLILDVASVTHAHKMHPLYWLFTFGRVVKHLSKFGVVADYKMSPWQSALVWATQHLLAWQHKRRIARSPD